LASALRKIDQRDLDEARISLPQFPLPEKTFLIEIPGLGAINPAHGRMIDRFLDRASAIIFVVEIQGPLSQTEAELLMDIRSSKIPVFVYLSGGSGTMEGEVAQGQRKIDEILQRTQPEIPIFFSDLNFASSDVLGVAEIRQHLENIKYSEENVLRGQIRELEHLYAVLSSYVRSNLPRNVEAPASPKSLDPRDRKRDLLLRMIADQCNDVHTTFHEHTEAIAYTVRNRPRQAQKDVSSSDDFVRQLKFGLEDVRSRMEMLSEKISNELAHKRPMSIEDFCDFDDFLRRVERVKPQPPNDYRLIKYLALMLGTLFTYFSVFLLTSPFLISPFPYLPALCGSLSGLIVFGVIIVLFGRLLPSSAGNETDSFLTEADQLVEACTLSLQEKLVDQVGKEFGQKNQPQPTSPEKNNFTEALSVLDKISHEIDDLKRMT